MERLSEKLGVSRFRSGRWSTDLGLFFCGEIARGLLRFEVKNLRILSIAAVGTQRLLSGDRTKWLGVVR
jgi:hypothetical protein